MKSGGLAHLVHQIFQRTGLPPDEFWAKPRGAQLFMLASTQIVLEEERQREKALDTLRQGR
ncbi:hypothetical protein A6M21_11895 [Desulfotomaculum copahuensis]|uniref:Uncharacterized protein n=1 Tax=Desulfotomaculum copahuensis TaxID=1838280 RepID=A0A1B7LDG5_9FIRM|nr:hypothetical protein A6M21_11895 [Desulfotomaculum copahuensis]